MKIALTIEKVGSGFGGAESTVAMFARVMHDAGHEVAIFARKAGGLDLPPGVRVELLSLGPLGRVRWLRAVRFAQAAAAAVRAGDFDLTIGFNKTYAQDVLIAVAGAHPGTLEYNRARFRSPLRRAWWSLGKRLNPTQIGYRWIDRQAFGGNRPGEPGGEVGPFVIAPSAMVAEHFRRFHGVPADRIAVVPNGIRLPDEPPTPAETAERRARFRQRAKLAESDVAALFIAWNYALKGLEPLLQAFAQLAPSRPTAALVVCGSPKTGCYEAIAERLGIADRVRWIGPVSDPRDAYAGCELLAFPTFYDPGALVVAEAQVAGLPVVTTRQNGAGELLTEGVDGFVIDSPWATEALADRIARLIDGPDLRRRMSEAAAADAQRHDLKRRLQETLAALPRPDGEPRAGDAESNRRAA
ncbi:glycosyltransferase family 4 protein [Alienimonas californiensis]|uniref:Lipopolysaccharide core biosynthesis protein RfaG n=1 Tax=Alienimonas californiensis TaxID=2527989 RepID=A0A517P9X3_9PLAN|nr:glycosyltransferase family 4 protein [Alienimonas californiensis]QDT16173.1 Lipopolysaccharide core biosynthesis protein RfaG [Alienimonas californiensis]